MAKVTSSKKQHTPVHKLSKSGGRRAKTSAMDKTEKRSYKKYRGQGK
jgi:hypothetical protein